jgi:hypothetical protein
MENRTPFDLNEAIRRWQESLAASPALSADNLEELASHLRASVQRLQANGLSEEEAFLAATRHLGERGALEREFAKVAAVGPRLFVAVILLVGGGLFIFIPAASLDGRWLSNVILGVVLLVLGSVTILDAALVLRKRCKNQKRD